MSLKSVIAALLFVALSGAACAQRYYTGVLYADGKFVEKLTMALTITDSTVAIVKFGSDSHKYERLESPADTIYCTDGFDKYSLGVVASKGKKRIRGKVIRFRYTHVISLTNLTNNIASVYYVKLAYWLMQPSF